MTGPNAGRIVEAAIVAVPETAGSALYGMFDVLAATGTLWQELAGEAERRSLIRPRILSPEGNAFACGNGIPVAPHLCLADDPEVDIVVLPELWLAPDEPLHGRYPDLMAWLRERYRGGTALYSACSGSIMLAESGLLDGREATSHWGYEDLFRRCYPAVRFRPEATLVFAEPSGRIVTAGGTTSWHDLALHIVSRHCSPGEALRVAKAYLLKWHGEGQLPFTRLVRRQPHADSAVRRSEQWLTENFRTPNAVGAAVAVSGIPERSLKRRFKVATGLTLMDYLQNLRVEEAKRLLETGTGSFEEISAAVGYENTGFFRRLFRRRTGLTPGDYRRMFRLIAGGGATLELAAAEAAEAVVPTA